MNELNKIKRVLAAEVIASFWAMLRELEIVAAQHNGTSVLRIQVEGWYKQWNHMTDDDKVPSWTNDTSSRGVTNRVHKIIREQLGLPNDLVFKPGISFKDLGADSLDDIEIIIVLEDEFNLEIENEDAEKIHTVDDTVKYICRRCLLNHG